MEETFAFSASRLDGARQVVGSVVLQARFDACVETVVQCLTEWETPRGLRRKFYADTERKVLELDADRLV